MTTATLTERIIARKEGAVGWLIFNNPERRNAISVDMWEAIPPLLARAADDLAIRLVVFSGEGTKAFASGPPDKVSVVGLSQVAFGMLLDVIFWQRTFTLLTLAGIALVMAPTAWLLLGKRVPAATEEGENL